MSIGDNPPAKPTDGPDALANKETPAPNLNGQPGKPGAGEQARKPTGNTVEAGTLLAGLYEYDKPTPTKTSESGASANGSAKPSEILKALYQKISDNILPAMLDFQIAVPAATKKTYDITLTPEEEAQQKFPDAGNFDNAGEHNLVKELYVKMREAQLGHKPVKEALSVPERARLAARTMFPENDQECKDGRELTEKLLVKVLDKNSGKPLASYKPDKEDIELLAKIDSLRANDHNYLHNKDEILHPLGTHPDHHLPTEFNGVGYDEKTNSLVPRTFNLQKILEKRTRAALSDEVRNFDDKDQVQPDEEANLAFYLQVQRGVLPESLLSPDQEEQRNNLLAEYVQAYFNRNCNLSLLGEGDRKTAKDSAEIKYPTAAKMANLEGRPFLSDADDVYEFLTLNADVRRLAIKESLIIQLAGTPGFPREALPKIAELAAPDKARLGGFDIQRLANVNTALLEAEEGHRLGERAFIRTVEDSLAKQFISYKIDDPTQLKEKQLEDKHLASWFSAGNNWTLAYLRLDPNVNRAQIDAQIKYPYWRVCKTSLDMATTELELNYPLTTQARGAELIKALQRLQAESAPGKARDCEHLRNKQ